MKYSPVCLECNTPIQQPKKYYCSSTCKSRHWAKRKRSVNSGMSWTVMDKGIRRKLMLIDISGGGCEKCGYDKNMSALEFHHIDDRSKSFKLDARNISSRSWESILLEFDKCSLLCSNCHAEHHNPDKDMVVLMEQDKYLVVKNPGYIDSTIRINPPSSKDCSVCNEPMGIYTKTDICLKCRRSTKPDKQQLYDDLMELRVIRAIARKYNKSKNTIIRWLKGYNIDYKPHLLVNRNSPSSSQ